MTTEEKIKVMQAHVDGKAIQILNYCGSWSDISESINWNWFACEYRIKPEPKTIRVKINEDIEVVNYMCIGKAIKHRDSNYYVYVVDGAYERNGRVSNNWTWRKIFGDGTLGVEESGYGWKNEPS